MNKISALLKLLCNPIFAGRDDMLPEYERAFVDKILGDTEIPCLSFWRGRVALWTILKALNIGNGDEVVLPAYTCEMVPTAIKFAGGRCRYYDVDAEDFNSSIETISQVITPKTSAVICQHTYGCRQNVDALVKSVSNSGISVVEDCCQLVDFFDAQNIGVAGAATFFSTQWSKPYSTGLGGMAVFSDRLLYEKSKKIRDSFSDEFKRKQAWRLALQVLMYKLTVFPRTKAIMAALYRVLQQVGMIQGTTTIAEYGGVMPENYLASASNTQAILGLQALKAWHENIEHRRMLTHFYLENISQLGANLSPALTKIGNRALWAIPLLVENKQKILCHAGRLGLPIATWFKRLPVHIASDTAYSYDYVPGQCFRSEQMFMREIHLPTSPSVKLRHAEAVIKLLKKYAVLTVL